MLNDKNNNIINHHTPRASVRARLQKVLAAAASASWDGTAVVRDGAEDLEFLLEVFA